MNLPVRIARVSLRPVCCTLILLLLFPGCASSRKDRVVVGCKNFTEQLILGEIIAQQLEAKTHLEVDRRFYLAGTFIAHQAIVGGRVPAGLFTKSMIAPQSVAISTRSSLASHRR